MLSTVGRILGIVAAHQVDFENSPQELPIIQETLQFILEKKDHNKYSLAMRTTQLLYEILQDITGERIFDIRELLRVFAVLQRNVFGRKRLSYISFHEGNIEMGYSPFFMYKEHLYRIEMTEETVQVYKVVPVVLTKQG